ncbi:hypothetical protein Z517_09430 [Fonsecaea pedrosoi CBS 271.37]|uniref:Unplaced genomic scaffold supercont1.6, whole genome shotgun sequence n=1 Tax=Fonsecaea pedrosoi CBS 271.37 TaxID=1442368 RepID=A0A0D2DH39_9EURO|nr:uncharacterized protein Z517_09430 [Fonsecaea pedrosoi CBS 271.37]KIW76986.1 hypothetical protein Z517_09430 [Fonsecaea pedrosoi CBS 271.37]
MSNKDRLYICRHARGGQPRLRDLEDTYHWAFMIGPKVEEPDKDGVRYRAKNKVTQDGIHWEFEKGTVPLRPTNMLLVRVLIGKVDDLSRLDAILCRTPVKDGAKDWNCVAWLKDALELVGKDKAALGTSVIPWDTVRKAAMEYCNQKRRPDGSLHSMIQGRFQPTTFWSAKR